MKYGELPKQIGLMQIDCPEMMFYQYLPISLAGSFAWDVEERLVFLSKLIFEVSSDYADKYGATAFHDSFMYLTVKRAYQTKNCSYNRLGYHSDGFLTDDVNYIWCDSFPTIFNQTDFNLTLDHELSMKEMNEQAKPENEITFPVNSMLRLDQYNIHKVNEDCEGMRTFVKISFSKDKYDLIGNSHNYLLDYDWEMRERKTERNAPQKH